MKRKELIILFVRYPEKGSTKTRLAGDIGDENALTLYRFFAKDMMRGLQKSSYEYRIYYSPPNYEKKMSLWLGKDNTYRPQRGNDLGQRMKNAFEETFREGFDKVLLIGSDCPDLPYEFYGQAMKLIDQSGAVIGPSSDGGYYLIGFSKSDFPPRVFEGIAWGSDCVFKDTLEILRKEKQRYSLLEEWRDIDTLSDLRYVFHSNKNTAFPESGTYKFLANVLKVNEYLY